MGGILVAESAARPCGDVRDDELARLHLYYRPRSPDDEGWSIHGLEIGADYRISEKWVYVGASGTRFPNSSLVTTRTGSGRPGLVIAPIVGEESAFLLLLDSETGAEVDRISFDGVPYFTMPVVIGERILLASRDDAVFVFEPEPSSLWADYQGRGRLPRLLAAITP